MKCKIEDCEKDVTSTKGAWGYCGKHAQRVRRYGNPHYLTPESVGRDRNRRAQPKLGKCKSTTYKKFRGRHEHRVIAEARLGRKLERWEHVHHKDGDRHNNSPDNLVVLTEVEHAKQHHPKGKRPNRKTLLTDEQIIEIRASKVDNSTLGRLYNCNPSNIWAIKHRKVYKYVTDA